MLEFVHESVLPFVLDWKGGTWGIGRPGSENTVHPCAFLKASMLTSKSKFQLIADFGSNDNFFGPVSPMSLPRCQDSLQYLIVVQLIMHLKWYVGLKKHFFFPDTLLILTRIISIKKPGRVCLFHWLIYLYHFLKEISEFRTSGKWQKDWDCMNLHCWISRYTVLCILY